MFLKEAVNEATNFFINFVKNKILRYLQMWKYVLATRNYY